MSYMKNKQFAAAFQRKMRPSNNVKGQDYNVAQQAVNAALGRMNTRKLPDPATTGSAIGAKLSKSIRNRNKEQRFKQTAKPAQFAQKLFGKNDG